jgi:haloacid dehalogenase-like hydrolase
MMYTWKDPSYRLAPPHLTAPSLTRSSSVSVRIARFRFGATTAFTICVLLLLVAGAHAQTDPLPSWNDGKAKRAIVEFVHATTEKTSASFLPPQDRIATFDQDGTTWVEQPMYTQVEFALDRVVTLAPKHPEWGTTPPFKYVLAGDKAAMARFTIKDLEVIVFATHTGMSVEAFRNIVKNWIAKSRNPRWNRPYTELVYQPMLEVMSYLHSSGYKIYMVTGGGQEFVRAYSDRVYGIPREQVIGSALQTEFIYNSDGHAILMRPPKLLLNNNFSGKPQDIYLFLGRAPAAAFGNSTGDRQMLEYAGARRGRSLEMLVLHDDAEREYAYGPAEKLPPSQVGTFSQALYDEARFKGWIVISMKNDWKRIFAFEK